MPDYFYVYPAYLAKGLTREEGRRLPESATLTDVTAEEIAAAAKRLGAKAEVEADKHYPRQAHRFGGRVKVTKRSGSTKTAFLRAVAAELGRQRAVAGKR
ncbi:MAG TPA: signal recognition particle subunit SRP19/SEC65 family protein [Thermoplasmata archaeon]|nr:signal recognition particle subunit SRP19/SEC65 family protein [Thermoplasmata archaeon]